MSCRPSPNACSTRPPTKASRSVRSTRRWIRSLRPRCPASGRSPAAGTAPAMCCRGGASWRRSRARGRRPATATPRCCPRCPTGSAGWCCGLAPAAHAAGDVDRRLEGVFLELVPVVLDAGVDYAAAADAVLALVAALPEDRRSALSIDCGADPLTAGAGWHAGPLDRSRDGTRGPVGRLRWRGAGDHGRRPDSAQSRRQRGVGTGRCARRGRRVPAGAHRRRSGCRGRLAADQLSGSPPTTTSS